MTNIGTVASILCLCTRGTRLLQLLWSIGAASLARQTLYRLAAGCESVKGLSRETKEVPQPCNLVGNSMNIQEENSAHYFRVQSERELTLD